MGETLRSSLCLSGMNVTAYTFDAVKTVFVKLFCTPKTSTENPSLRVNRHGGCMNKPSKNLVLKTNLDNGPSMKCPASKVTLMRDHVYGHGTTTSMPGSPDHSKGADR